MRFLLLAVLLLGCTDALTGDSGEGGLSKRQRCELLADQRYDQSFNSCAGPVHTCRTIAEFDRERAFVACFGESR